MIDDALSLLIEIKGDLGETHGIVSALRGDLAEHREEDRRSLRELRERLGALEGKVAQVLAAEDMRRRGESRRAAVIAAIVGGVIALFSQLVQYLKH
jgi:hypothetical protein